MALRTSYKNVSSASFKGNTILGVKSATFTMDAREDADLADNEKDAVVWGIQEFKGTAEIETGDVSDILKKFSIGESGSLRVSLVAKKSGGTAVTILVKTAYCNTLNVNGNVGDFSSTRAGWTFSSRPTYS